MEEKITIPIHARYFTFGDPQAENLLVVLHGYGQLASFFLKKFEFLDQKKYFVIAPEGLHRFYINGTSGRVGASWMTKENRVDDIKNYLLFLTTILSNQTNHSTYRKRILLGFSQGGATASRLVEAVPHFFDAFLLWAAVFPPDMAQDSLHHFDSLKNFLVIGDQDPYYSEDTVVMQQENLKQRGMNFAYIQYNGTHTVDAQTLQKILNEI